MYLSSHAMYSFIGKHEASSEVNQGLRSRMWLNLYIILTRRFIKVTGFKLILFAGEEPKIAAYLINYQSIRTN